MLRVLIGIGRNKSTAYQEFLLAKTSTNTYWETGKYTLITALFSEITLKKTIQNFLK